MRLKQLAGATSKNWESERNVNLVKIDKFYPSSKRCSNCGFILKKLDLSVRKWVCTECKASHLRDVNAAKNILQAGHAVLAGCDKERQD